MANGHGGARPGAGRKKQSTKEAQQVRRDIYLDVFSPEETRETALAMLEKVKSGDPKAFAAVAPYFLGKEPDELKADVTVKGGVTIFLPERKAE